MGLVYDEDNSRSARIKRALLSPSKRTVLIAAVLLLLILSPLIMKTIGTAQEGIGSVTAESDLDINTAGAHADLEDSGIAPFLVSQGEIMMAATSPKHWKVGNYRFGVCSSERVGEITDTSYSAAIVEACDVMYDIQGKYSRDCYLARTCDVKSTAKGELIAVANDLKTAHSTAGFIWPNP